MRILESNSTYSKHSLETPVINISSSNLHSYIQEFGREIGREGKNYILKGKTGRLNEHFQSHQVCLIQ